MTSDLHASVSHIFAYIFHRTFCRRNFRVEVSKVGSRQSRQAHPYGRERDSRAQRVPRVEYVIVFAEACVLTRRQRYFAESFVKLYFEANESVCIRGFGCRCGLRGCANASSSGLSPSHACGRGRSRLKIQRSLKWISLEGRSNAGAE